MAKEPTSQGEGAAPQKSRRKPLTIDLPAEEVARKPPEGGPVSEASSAAAATATPGSPSRPDAPSPAAPAASEPPKTSVPTSGVSASAASSSAASAAQGAESPKAADPVIPSAFAARGAERGAPPKEAAPSVRTERPRSVVAFLLAGLAGGAIVAVAVIVLTSAGYLAPSSPESPDASAEIASLRSEVAVLQQKVDSVAPFGERLAALEKSVAELASRAPPGGSDAAALKTLQDRLAKLESAGGVAAPSTDLGPRLMQLEQDIAALKSAAPPDTASLEATLATLRQDVDALAKRMDAAPGEERIAAIEAKLDATSRGIANAAALAPAVAADALAAALDAGRPFTSELAALKSLGVDAEAVAALAPQAEAGLPTLSALRSGFEDAIASVELQTPIPEDSGAIDRLLQSARGLVEVRPAHPTAGSDPGAIVARIRGALAAGDLTAALAEWATLPDAIKAPTADWAKAAEARLKADELVAKVRTAALSKLGARQ